MRVLPTTWQCPYTRPRGSCAAPRLSRTLLYSKESVQNINLPILKGESSARCILTAKYVRNASWQHLPADVGGRGCSPVSAASVCTRSSWGRESRQLEQGVMLGQSHVLFLFHPPLPGGARGWVTDPVSVLLSFK